MTSMAQLEIDERRIGYELLKDPTLDAGTIATRLGLSKQKVWRVIKKMEKGGVILSHPSSLNPRKMGKRTFLLLFERSSRPMDNRFVELVLRPRIIEETEQKGIKAVVEDSYYLNGVHDWAIIITVDEHKDLLKWIELWRRDYAEYYTKISQSEIMWIHQRNSILNKDMKELYDVLRS
jgi:DNA-binding Lrp family transcriptional regulator